MAYPAHLNQSEVLSTFTQTPAETIKQFTENLLNDLGKVKVIQNRTGLVMMPYRDTAQGELFHLGEVLVAEAHVRLEQHDMEGYAACLGRDLEQALAVAILDASLSANIMLEQIEPFVTKQAKQQQEIEETLLKQVEATLVEMETF